MSSKDDFRYLVADIGGTNSRFAVGTGYDLRGGHSLAEQRVFANADFETLDQVLEKYLSDLPGARPPHACLAVAAPVKGDSVQLTNIDWCFSIEQMRQRFGFLRLDVLNDFAALACSAPLLSDTDLTTLQPGRPAAYGTKAILGPGTGFGAAALIWTGQRWHPLSGEAGHAAFAPSTAEERELLDRLSAQIDHVAVETLVCGRGLVTIYRTLADSRRQPAPLTDPAQITSAGLNHTDELCEDALGLFADILAAAAGDLALTFGARGGVYLGGGMAQRLHSYLKQQRFIDRFLNKGVMRPFLEEVPLYLITHEQPALVGAAAWLESINDRPLSDHDRGERST